MIVINPEKEKDLNKWADQLIKKGIKPVFELIKQDCAIINLLNGVTITVDNEHVVIYDREVRK